MQRICYITQDKEEQTVVQVKFPTLPVHLTVSQMMYTYG